VCGNIYSFVEQWIPPQVNNLPRLNINLGVLHLGGSTNTPRQFNKAHQHFSSHPLLLQMHQQRLRDWCTTPRWPSPTIAIRPDHIAAKDASNHHTYAKQMKVTNLNRYKGNRSKPLKK